jgi:hypothetical protein
MRGPNDHPQTLGEFVRLDWSVRASCICSIAEQQLPDLPAALAIYGPHYPSSQFLSDMKCRRCGEKLGYLTQSPEDRERDRVLLEQLRAGGTWGQSRQRGR